MLYNLKKINKNKRICWLLHGGKAGFRVFCSSNPEGSPFFLFSFFFLIFFPFLFSELGLRLGFEPKRSNRETISQSLLYHLVLTHPLAACADLITKEKYLKVEDIEAKVLENRSSNFVLSIGDFRGVLYCSKVRPNPNL